MEEYKDDEDGLIKHLTTHYPSFAENYEWMDRIYRNTPVFEMSCNNTNLKSRFSITGRIVSHEGKDIEAWTDITQSSTANLTIRSVQPTMRLQRANGLLHLEKRLRCASSRGIQMMTVKSFRMVQI